MMHSRAFSLIFFCSLLAFFTVSCDGFVQKPSIPKPTLTANASVETDSAAIDTSFFGINLEPKGNYEHAKRWCLKAKNDLQLKYTKALSDSIRQQKLDEARYLMTENLLNTIIPFWYGTPWAFEGYTATPQQGEIACGYFVSTTLKHSGFNLDRYRLAQKSPGTEAKSIQLSDSIGSLENLSPAGIKNFFLQNKKDGLYFAGLSSHVGYLLKRKGELFFIHSNYIGTSGVTIEKAIFSNAFGSSQQCFIADITHNNALVKAWLAGTVIKVRD